jgi:hypothetical protein
MQVARVQPRSLRAQFPAYNPRDLAAAKKALFYKALGYTELLLIDEKLKRASFK